MKAFNTIWLTDEEGIKIFFSNDSRILIHDIPRSQFNEINKKLDQDFNESGVYILYQTSAEEDADKSKVYIGEAYDVRGRINQHLDETKDEKNTKLWTERIIAITSSAFSSYSEFTKTEIHFLEKVLIEKFMKNPKFIVANKNKGQGRVPNKIMEIKLEEEVDLILNGLKSFGYNIFNNGDVLVSNEETSSVREEGIKIQALISKTKQTVDAILMANDNVLIKKGTRIKNRARNAESNQYLVKLIIDTLCMSKSIENQGDYIEYDITFIKDVNFKKPSSAGYLIAGGHNNGWFTWRNMKNEPIDKYRK